MPLRPKLEEGLSFEVDVVPAIKATMDHHKQIWLASIQIIVEDIGYKPIMLQK